MGVPAFFRKLIKKHKIISYTNNRKIDYLYIDANCLFHPQCFIELDQNINETNINILNLKMFDRIIKYIDTLINYVKPDKFIFIAVDGVAPLAKISQQRIRRFANTNNYKHKIMLKHNIKFNDKWSNIVITPATQFMNDLHKKLLEHFNNNKKIIYSSYLENGEGEHKILQHLKSINYRENDKCVIYGLDADLIFLALASNKPNIFLLRETNQVTNDDDKDKDIFCYVDINEMKSCIRKENINTDDYIFICYFLGNDFLPHLPSIDININGYELLLGVYLEIYDKLLTNLIIRKENKIIINEEFLLTFIEKLCSYETIFFKKELPEYLLYKRQQQCYETELYKKEIWEYENLKNLKIIDTIKLYNPGFKERYYKYYFHIESISNDDLKNKICHNYLEGLLWVANYYFLECNSWRWLYKYTHPPFLSDIYNYLKTKNINKDFTIINEKAINMNTQLLCVIPPQFSHILPPNIKHLNSSINSPIIDMFPMMYKLDMINKTQLYKCIPILPYLDIDRVEKAIMNLDSNLKI